MEELTNLEKLYLVWSMINTAVLTMIAIYTWASNRNKATRADSRHLTKKVNELSGRIVALEQGARFAPNKSDMDGLHERVTEIAKGQAAMRGEVHQMNGTLHLIQEHLLKRDAK